MPSFKVDLSDSANDFLRVVWPALRSPMGGGEVVPVEGSVDSVLANKFDTNSGIDYWHFSLNGQMRGLATRVQWCDRSWGTFTVRYSRDSGARTEYHKRLEAIYSSEGWLYPYFTIQAYVANPRRQGALISACAIKTKDLMDICADIERAELAKKHSPAGGMRRTNNAVFLYVYWNWLESNGVATLRSPQPAPPAQMLKPCKPVQLTLTV